MGSNREVDLQGNCSKCGGVHFGTGPDCVYGKPVQNSTIPPTLQTGREQPQGEATRCPHGTESPELCVICRAQTEGGEKPHVHCWEGDDPHRCSLCCQCSAKFKPSSPPATAGTAREFYAQWNIWLDCLDADNKNEIFEFAEAYADQRVRPLQISLAKLYAAIGPMDELDTVDDAVARVAKLRQERDADRKEFMQMLEYCRTLLADGMTAVRKAVQSREWLTEGRGCYEWNDDNWHKEFAYAAKEILDAVAPFEKEAGNLYGCPQKWEEIVAARRNLRAELAKEREARERAERERDKLAGDLAKTANWYQRMEHAEKALREITQCVIEGEMGTCRICECPEDNHSDDCPVPGAFASLKSSEGAK